MNLWLLLPLLLPMLAGLLLLTKPFAEGKIRRLTVQIGLILTLVSLLPAFLTSGRDLTLFTLSDNVEIALHVDGIGMCFCVLMAFVWTAAGFYSFDYMAHEGHEKRFYCLYLLTLGVLMGLCMSGSLVTFYMFYEAMTLLTMPLVMHSGSKEAVAAGIKYLIYSVVGASLVLLGIFAIAPYAQSLSFAPGGALDMAKVAGHEGFVLAIGGVMLLGFGAKAGLYPLHGWLPDAHSQAPTAGSVDLAGILLKTAAYGLLRFALPLFPNASAEFAPIAMWLGVIGIFYGAWMAFAQTDIKRLIAYTSVSHMGFVLIAIYTGSQLAYQGAVIQMIAHGLSAAGLFILCGQLYERLHTRDMRQMGGLWSKIKWLPAMSMFFAVATLGMPGTGNFVGEFMILFGSYKVVPVITVISTFGLVFASVYSLSMLHRAYFGKAKSEIAAKALPGMSLRELSIILLLVVLLVLLGFFPQPILDTSHAAMSNIQQWFVNSVSTTRP